MRGEFAWDAGETERAQKFGATASELLTDMHEVIGHASGQQAAGFKGSPQESIRRGARPSPIRTAVSIGPALRGGLPALGSCGRVQVEIDGRRRHRAVTRGEPAARALVRAQPTPSSPIPTHTAPTARPVSSLRIPKDALKPDQRGQPDVVAVAGLSAHRLGDREVLAHDTHKFESRYFERLVGPYPGMAATYRERSPIHFVDRLACALILFQGLEDKVVPPNQSQMMADAVRAKGCPVAYLAFAGEQHGFRQAATIIRCLDAELYFYGAVFGFTPADTTEPVTIDNR